MTRFEESEASEIESEEISLRQIGRTIRKYRVPIQLAMLGIAALLILLVAVAYLLMPTQHVTTLDFRLTFRGAERGQYPNGTPFSSSEIISPTVLNAVFKAGEYERFMSYEQFKSSLYVVESNDELEALTRTYRARLADPKLSAVDRDRIEQEFQQKKASLSKAEYAISMAAKERVKRVPQSVRAKILNDILATWAEQTVDDKGVSLYDISILSSGIFNDAGSPAYDYLVGLDVVRGKIAKVVDNVEQLTTLPGAKVLRTEKTNRSLGELGSRLADLNAYRLRPLVGMIASDGLAKNPGSSLEFLRSQLSFKRLEVQEAQARVASVRDSLERYLQERQQGTEQTAPSGGEQQGGSTMTLLDKGFLDRILELSNEGNDLAYRQRLVDEYRKASMEVVPLESEVRYYEMLLQSFTAGTRAANESERALIESETKAITAEAVQATNEVNEIYERLSKDLNPSTMLYSTTGPITTSNQRAASGLSLLIAALVMLMLAFPVVVLGTILYERFGESGQESESTVPAQKSSPASSASERLAQG
jgi:hypothetical protein